MKKIFLFLVLSLLLISCVYSDNTKNEDNINETPFNYEQLFENYMTDLDNGVHFSILFDNYFYDNIELKKDTSWASPYFYNKLENEILVMFLSEEYQNNERFWDEEILESGFKYYYNDKCDCQLIIESAEERLEIIICFYKHKFYSLTGGVPPNHVVLKNLNGDDSYNPFQGDSMRSDTMIMVNQ